MANGFRDPRTGTLFPSREFFQKQKTRQTAGLPSTFGIGTQAQAPRPDLAAISRGVQDVAGQIPGIAQGVSRVTGQPATIVPQFQQQFPQLAQQIRGQQAPAQVQAPSQFKTAPLPVSTGVGAGTVGGATDDLRAQLLGIRERITESLSPSEAELAAEKRLQDLITSRELGLAQTAEQPIATPFITGQQAAITRRASLQALPLKTQLAQLQSRRQAALDVGKAELGFAESDIERQERAAGETSIVESGGRQLLINTRTGETIRDIGAAEVEAKQTAITEAGGRRILVDKQTGEQIADLGTAAAGGLVDLTKLLTVTEAEKLGVPFGTSVGDALGETPAKLQATKDEKVNQIGMIDRAIELIEGGQAETGPIVNLQRMTAEKGIFPQSESQRELNNLVTQLKAGALFSVGGKQLTTAEIAILSPFLPEISRDEKVNLTNLRQLKAKVEEIHKGVLDISSVSGAGGEGGQFQVTAPDGVNYQFPSQEAADAFRREIGQ